jgi:glycosyltransferase involved in cell wall biosynthesis
MESMYIFSVCISALNEEENLEACIESVLNASKGHDCELLLLDNGSCDRTQEIMRKYSEVENCRIISFKENMRLQYARNFLLKNCHGKFAVFLDADGVVNNDYFSVLVENLSPRFSIYSGPVIEQSVDENVFYELHYATLAKSDPNFLIGANFVVEVSVALEVGGFPDITVSRGDESPLIALMLKNGSKQLLVTELIASNHFISSSSDFIRSFYYEGQNAYLCMLYFDEPFFAKSMYKGFFLSSLLLLIFGLLTLNVGFVLTGMALIVTKLVCQRKYWIQLFYHFLKIASLSSAKGFAVTIAAHITHELGFWLSMLTRKKPNCWKG